MAVVHKRCLEVAYPAIGANRRTSNYVLRQKPTNRLLVSIARNGQADASHTLGSFSVVVGIITHLNNSENQRLCSQSGHVSFRYSINGATYDRFTGLNGFLLAGSGVTDHCAPQMVRHEPSIPVCAPDLTFKLFGTELRRMCRHQICRLKQFLYAHMASVKCRTRPLQCATAALWHSYQNSFLST